MTAFFSFLKVVIECGTVLLIVMMVLLSLPACKLRAVGLELTKYAIVVGLVILVFSPLDLLPGLPFDDALYVIGAIMAGRSALKSRETRLLYDEAEMAELRSRTQGGDDAS